MSLAVSHVIFINVGAELQKRADRADQSVLFFLAGANFWEKHAKNRRKHTKTGENRQKQAKNRRFFGANFYAFCNYDPHQKKILLDVNTIV